MAAASLSRSIEICNPISIRDVRGPDLPTLLALNESAVPHVNSIGLEVFTRFMTEARYFRVAEEDSQPAGFLIAFSPEAGYQSVNFLWFRARYTDFLYIDRVVVCAARRGSGIGGALYRDLQRFCSRFASMLTCEVNIRPSNEASMRFHRDFGFEQVGTQSTEGGHKLVSLMAKGLPAAAEAEDAALLNGENG